MSCDDSVSFLKKWSAVNVNVKIDLLYLDSWDLDLYNSVPSALHGLAEFLAVSNNLQSGSLLLIDDTPHDLVYFKKVLGEDRDNELKAVEDYYNHNGFYPGKGTLVKELLKSTGRGEELMHEYQLLWRF